MISLTKMVCVALGLTVVSLSVSWTHGSTKVNHGLRSEGGGGGGALTYMSSIGMCCGKDPPFFRVEPAPKTPPPHFLAVP